MIKTITLNPAIDKTLILSELKLDQVNRATSVREDPGGKGINVSKMVVVLGGESEALGICGGKTGEHLMALLDTLGIHHQFIETPTATRTNIKLVDSVSNTFTDINEPGGPITEAVFKAFKNLLMVSVSSGDFLVLAGSLPPGLPPDTYANIIDWVKPLGVKVILDADGEAFRLGVESGPYMVKPNQVELSQWLGRSLETKGDCLEAAEALMALGVEKVVISLGSKGCLLVTNDTYLEASALDITVKSTVGAGDSLVGGYVYGMSTGLNDSDSLKLGVACSGASIMKEGTLMGDLETIKFLVNQVKIASLLFPSL